MKIGILTFHRALNYGAVLQCYALKSILTSRGHSVEIIDYTIPAIINSNKIISLQRFRKQRTIIAKFKYLFVSFWTFFPNIRARTVFRKFIYENMTLSTRVRSICDVPKYYDSIVFGSDQIWSPRICDGFDQVLSGQFDKGGTSFVSYAASLGSSSVITSAQWKEIDSFLCRFDSISVREKTLQTGIEQNTSHRCKLCLDPTLLLGRDAWDNLVVMPHESDFVLHFTVQNDDNSILFAKKLSQKLGCLLIVISAKAQLHYEEDCMYREGISPSLFLGYIKSAKYIVTNSFHVTAFSILFHKDFFALQSIRSERVESLLGQLGLKDRIVNSSDPLVEKKDINYETIDKKLSDLRIASFDFLSDSNL